MGVRRTGMWPGPANAPKRHGTGRGTGGCRKDLLHGAARFAGTQGPDIGLAHPPLAGAHGVGAVALQQFDVTVAFHHGIGHVLGGHVFTEAGEALFEAFGLDAGHLAPDSRFNCAKPVGLAGTG